ncbi:MAG: thiolase family protein [Acidobacteria bacterium]|nr:thiolase family protein [Acidobacteriota bacterium]
MTDAVIVSAARTPVGKAPLGQFRYARPDDLAAMALRAVLDRAPAIDPATVDDVVIGCAMPEAEQGMNVARIASLRAGVPHDASAVTVNRFCASGLEAIVCAVDRIGAGRADVVLAGGTESMSLVPMGGHKIAPNPDLMRSHPDVYLSTGLVAETHAREYGIDRDAQDAYALESHRRAVAAIDAGRFAPEMVAVPTTRIGGAAATSALAIEQVLVESDEGPRRDTSMDALARLRPAFLVNGTVTAGNSSQMSDGAAAVLVLSAARAREVGLMPLARLVAYATAGVEPERFGIGPVPAIRKVLRRAGLSLAEIDLVELNEAFASQVLACARDLDLDRSRLNVNGGAIALGHPLGCTGARLTVSLLHEMARRQARYGLVSMCVGGGMGAAAVFERL